MRFPVVVNGEPMPAECGFATLADLKVVTGWARLGKASREPAVQDAAEFAGLACKRWRFYRRAGRFARSMDEVRDIVSASPRRNSHCSSSPGPTGRPVRNSASAFVGEPGATACVWTSSLSLP